MRYFQLFLIFISIFLFLSCQKPAPQLPANKSNETDSTGLALLKINESLIAAEDSLIAGYVLKTDSIYTKDNQGFWYKINFATKSGKQKELETCKISYSVYSLDKEFLFRKEEMITLGKKQTINGIEELLKLMHKGEKATLILPWYLAYGMKGDGGNVNPYTSVIVYLHLVQ
ncbi:MAG: FKBP-type peptidyl-prolyl cis-trans isomerase [Bacteroidales bacterium]|nr:FKBP-type peptidyl-prolyl cis-trans isomerase [Bacteroidales bacterium]